MFPISKKTTALIKILYVLFCGMLFTALLFAAIPDMAEDTIEAFYLCRDLVYGSQRFLFLSSLTVLIHITLHNDYT